MLQDSPQRLLEAIARQLHELTDVVAHDEVVVGQLRAAIELLGNLATRVGWDPTYLADIDRRARAVIELDPDGPTNVTASDASETIEERVRRRLREVAVLLERSGTEPDLPTDLRDALEEFAGWHEEQELTRLRSASFGAPPER